MDDDWLREGDVAWRAASVFGDGGLAIDETGLGMGVGGI